MTGDTAPGERRTCPDCGVVMPIQWQTHPPHRCGRVVERAGGDEAVGFSEEAIKQAVEDVRERMGHLVGEYSDWVARELTRTVLAALAPAGSPEAERTYREALRRIERGEFSQGGLYGEGPQQIARAALASTVPSEEQRARPDVRTSNPAGSPKVIDTSPPQYYEEQPGGGG